jgi:hypothetical protein
VSRGEGLWNYLERRWGVLYVKYVLIINRECGGASFLLTVFWRGRGILIGRCRVESAWMARSEADSVRPALGRTRTPISTPGRRKLR